jgi:ribosomal protein S3AE
MPFKSSCTLCTCSNYMPYSLNGENDIAIYKQWKSLYPLKKSFLTDVKVVRQKG